VDKDIAEKISWAEDLLKEYKESGPHKIAYDFLSHELLFHADPDVRQKCRELLDWAAEHNVA